MERKGLSFINVGVILTILLFVVIIVLSLYLLDVIKLPNFFLTKTNLQQTNTELSQIKNNTTDNTNRKNLFNPLPKIVVNDSDKWVISEIPNSKMKITSDVRINAAMLVKFQESALPNSNAGLIFDNGLKENDPNLRRMSLLYLLELKRWSLKYQAGKDIKYSPVIANPPEKIFGSFSLLIPSNGKSVVITLQNKTTKTMDFPQSLYGISNQMVMRTQVGPKSNITFSSLNYQTDPQ